MSQYLSARDNAPQKKSTLVPSSSDFDSLKSDFKTLSSRLDSLDDFRLRLERLESQFLTVSSSVSKMKKTVKFQKDVVRAHQEATIEFVKSQLLSDPSSSIPNSDMNDALIRFAESEFGVLIDRNNVARLLRFVSNNHINWSKSNGSCYYKGLRFTHSLRDSLPRLSPSETLSLDSLPQKLTP